jgi:hypothetical protein
LQSNAENDEADAQIEGEIHFTSFTEDEESEDNGVTGFEVIGEIDGKGREALQGLNLQKVHAYGAEQSMAEHEPEVRALRHNDDRLLAGKE